MEFISEDFNSNGAQQFLIPVQTDTKRVSNGAVNEVMVFHEHVKTGTLNLISYTKSFAPSHVKDIMQAPSNDFRMLFYVWASAIDVFFWKANIHHSQMSKALDKNAKNIGKYPSNIKYNKLYLDCQMYMPEETVTDPWCFPLVYFMGDIVLNLSLESMAVIHKQKDIQRVFQIPDLQWNNLIKKSEFKL